MSTSINLKPIFEVMNLKKHFPIKSSSFQKYYLKAVDGISLSINEGESLGLVGESGSGKTTFGRCAIRLQEPTEGKIIYRNNTIYDSNEYKQANMKPYRKHIQMIFQDPSASLDPRMTIAESIAQALDIHNLAKTKSERKEIVLELLNSVGLNSEHANRYPHEFSGGQQQRAGIARALAVNPELIVCDEPVSALDVSIQAQIINMLKDEKEKRGISYLFIAHDISVVRIMCERIGVMYLGNLVELASSESLCKNPLHPYTQMLISAIPIPDPKLSSAHKHIVLDGELPSSINPPSGCRFHTRCKYAQPRCKLSNPKLKLCESGHYCACHLY